MKTLVLGASGLIGNAVVRELVAQGHEITATSRCTIPPNNLSGLNVHYVSGDIDIEGKLDAWIPGHDVVIDAAAPYALHLLHAQTKAERHPVEYAERRTSTLLDAVRRHRVRLAYISTLLAQPSSNSDSLVGFQSRLVRKIYPYFAIKKLIEERILEAAERDLEIIVVQPTVCLGPWDVKPRKLCWVPKLLCGEIPASLQHEINVIDTRDVARGLVTALETGHQGKAIVLSGHNTSIDDLLSQFCEVAGVRVPSWRIPATLTVLPSLWAEFAWATIGSPSPLPSLVPALICEQRWIALSRLQRKLGASPRPLMETIRDTVGWYREVGYC